MDQRDDFLQRAYRHIRSSVVTSSTAHAEVLPKPSQLQAARVSLPLATGSTYLTKNGDAATLDHLLKDIAPALNGQSWSGRYYGFVTGSTLPIAEVADNLVTAYDQNVQVHLPAQTIATEIEDAALKMLIAVLNLGDAADWEGRTMTTGATASNILGLGCGREAVVQAKLPKGTIDSVGELGLLGACAQAGVREVQVLTSMGHSSLYKAASIVGLGRHLVKELPFSADEPWRLDIHAVEKELQRSGVVTIIALSAGEVNTGRFATTGIEDMRRLRNLADRYDSWIHVDGAFGIFARCLPQNPEFARLHQYVAGLELADSITVDGHKLLNVPYDCGMFFTRKASYLTSWCQNPNAAYLSGGATDGIQSPLNVGLQNSRRFRALPVYAVLFSEGREGIAQMMLRMVRLARGIAELVRDSPDYVLLPHHPGLEIQDTHVVVLFRAKDDTLNEKLVDTIHKSGTWYVSGTRWKGETAVRVAVSTWRVNVEEDLKAIGGYLSGMVEDHRNGN